MINALGLLEVDGMVAAIDAADAMLKAANVRLLSHEVLDPGRLTLVVEGDLAACRAALDAGCAAAMRTGRVISRKEIGLPDDDTQWLVTGFNRQPKQPVKEPDAPVIVAESADELLALLTSVRQGMTAGEVAAHFGWYAGKSQKCARTALFLPGRYVNAVVVTVSSPINLSEVPGVLQHPALTS
ncbi:ethanolamine utilization microcompartment protein EutK [Escherichia coli]|nr:ethanolamine utilization microcompartment protein EutK [Escherichia coli]